MIIRTLVCWRSIIFSWYDRGSILANVANWSDHLIMGRFAARWKSPNTSTAAWIHRPYLFLRTLPKQGFNLSRNNGKVDWADYGCMCDHYAPDYSWMIICAGRTWILFESPLQCYRIHKEDLICLRQKPMTSWNLGRLQSALWMNTELN